MSGLKVKAQCNEPFKDRSVIDKQCNMHSARCLRMWPGRVVGQHR